MNTMADKILAAALAEGRADELLNCLYEGGSATVDITTGTLVMVSASQLLDMVKSGD